MSKNNFNDFDLESTMHILEELTDYLAITCDEEKDAWGAFWSDNEVKEGGMVETEDYQEDFDKWLENSNHIYKYVAGAIRLITKYREGDGKTN